RVSLLVGGRAGGPHRRPGHDFDRRFVEPFDRSPCALALPPIASQPVQFFLGDEFGFAPMDEFAFTGRDRPDLASNGPDPQAIVADERKFLALLAEYRVQHVALAGGFYRPDRTIDPGEIQHAFKRNED